MAISGVSGSTSYREQWEANGGVYGNNETDESGSTSNTEQIWNAVFTDKKSNGVSTEDFLSLMVAQMTNQDFMNPMDDTQFVTQLAQFSSMQMMQEMANYTKTGYVMSLVGKPVTAARINVSGELLTETGPVQKVTLTNNEFGIYVNGKRFTLEQLMEIGTTGTTEDSGSTESTVSPEESLRRKEYLNSLLGREVSITVEDDEGSYDVTGVVEKVSTKDGAFRVYVNGGWYNMDDIEEVGDRVIWDDNEAEVPKVEDTDPGDEVNPDEKVDPDTDPSDEVNPDEKVDKDDPVDGADTDNNIDPEG